MLKELSKMKREIRKREYAICCPVCGRYQYKMMEGHTMFTCEKCKARFEAIVKDGKVILVEEEQLISADNDSMIRLKMKRQCARMN